MMVDGKAIDHCRSGRETLDLLHTATDFTNQMIVMLCTQLIDDIFSGERLFADDPITL